MKVKTLLFYTILALAFFILFNQNLKLKKEKKNDKEVLTKMLVNHLEELILEQIEWSKIDRAALSNTNIVEVFDCIKKDIEIDYKFDESIQYIKDTYHEKIYTSNNKFLFKVLGEKIDLLNQSKNYADQIRLTKTIITFFRFCNERCCRDIYFQNFGFVDSRDTLFLKENTKYKFPIFLTSTLVDFNFINDEFGNPLLDNSIHYLTPEYTSTPFKKQFTIKAKNRMDEWESFSKSVVIVLEK